MKGTPLRLVVIFIFSLVVSIFYLINNHLEESAIREKEEDRIRLLQIEYNNIYEAREQLKDYYSDIRYIQYDIEKCLGERGYSNLQEDRTVSKKDFDECTKIAHLINKVGNLEEIQKLALKPYPKEIKDYSPF